MVAQDKLNIDHRGGSRVFPRRGCTTRNGVSDWWREQILKAKTRIPVVLESCRSSKGGGGCATAEHSLYIRPWIISFTFLIIGFLITAASQAICQQQFNLFVGLCAQIKLGTIQVENRFPAKKNNTVQRPNFWLSWEKEGHNREVQSLAGLLNFACSVIHPGGAFLRTHIDLTIDRHPITVRDIIFA